jgi:ribosome biogenesis GTPase A
MDTPGVLWPKLDVEEYARHLAYTGSIRDQVMETYPLVIALLEELGRRDPRPIMERYKVDQWDEDPHGMFQAICKKRGWIIKGGEIDAEKGAMLILNEYRAGKLGRISLELPPKAGGEEVPCSD